VLFANYCITTTTTNIITDNYINYNNKGDGIEENDMDGICSMLERNKKCLQNVDQETRKEETTLEHGQQG
jgi:hypothetical protein